MSIINKKTMDSLGGLNELAMALSELGGAVTSYTRARADLKYCEVLTVHTVQSYRKLKRLQEHRGLKARCKRFFNDYFYRSGVRKLTKWSRSEDSQNNPLQRKLGEEGLKFLEKSEVPII